MKPPYLVGKKIREVKYNFCFFFPLCGIVSTVAEILIHKYSLYSSSPLFYLVEHYGQRAIGLFYDAVTFIFSLPIMLRLLLIMLLGPCL